ncbi:energy-coupling factor transporter transmembrane protein EcfT [Pseudomonas entomophila]|uniref:energy-coupling factor transporter transmembrane component T family protein n=1 Tax=Pseudomonas entomophila TaxID=312306 RepID=UPI0023D88426|nr:energy-coupling factor transporter transmembrane protein EcfT [Pseudomonas entomophila]MDF0730112.1 energy-coupling factor transporter transmembrane protein EcfT [Pseudomonas entomophila]
MMGLFKAGDSWLHRLAPGWKFLGLLALTTGVSLTPLLSGQLAWLAGVLALYLLAGLGLRPAWSGLLALSPFLVLIVLVQWLTTRWQTGAWLALSMYNAILLAGLLTLSTRVSSMLTLFERLLRPLARFGLDTWKVSLVLALTIRLIPTVTRAIDIARDACKARGFGRPGLRIILPVLVRLIRESEAIGDAIAARGLEADPALGVAEPTVNRVRGLAG